MRIGMSGGAWRHAIFATVLLLLAACGGGGGGGSDTGSGESASDVFSASFGSPQLQARSVEGHGTTLQFFATLKYTGSKGLWLGLGYDPAVVSDVSGSVAGDSLSGTLALRADLAPGVYNTTVSVHACFDEACTSSAPGSPATVPLSFEVLPNLKVQAGVKLQRNGRDAAPEVTLPVTVPAAAGAVTMSHNAYGDAFAIAFDGQSLRIETRQVRAGSYNAEIVLRGASDLRYERRVALQYTVTAPPTGEQPLTVSPPSLDIYVGQGNTQVQRFRATRPTWTDAWEPPQLCHGGDGLQLRDLGNDEYEVEFSAVGKPLGQTGSALCFSAGPHGGQTTVSLTLNVAAAFYPTANLNTVLDARTTVAQLTLSSPVLTADGLPARWSAVSRTPWLQLPRTGGGTGADLLEMQIDPAFGGSTELSQVALVDLWIDRPGTLPMTLQVGVRDNTPSLERTAAVFVGGKGRFYVDGQLGDSWSALLPTLQIEGATLTQAQVLADTRFVGDVLVLAVDVEGASAGVPITLRSAAPLRQSEVRLAVEAPARVPRGHLPLPFGSYRPPLYAASADALFFAGPDRALRWSHSGSSWTLAQAALPGLVDLALRQDEQRLFASSGTDIQALDPADFRRLDQGTLQGRSIGGALNFDPAVPAGVHAMVFAADGRALASLAGLDPAGERLGRAAYWVGGVTSTRALPDLTSTPGIRDPGSGSWSSTPIETGVGLVASAGAHSVAGTDPSGRVQFYRPAQRSWSAGPLLPAGVRVVALSEDGQRLLRSDGVVMSSGSESGNLAGLAPAGHVAAGYGITPDGRHALVYTYRVALESGADRARDAALYVFDLQNLAAPAVATLPLDEAVGCLDTLTSGESCMHSASVTVTAGAGSVFVLGPRGLAALPLPADMAPTAAPRRPLRIIGPLRPANRR